MRQLVYASVAKSDGEDAITQILNTARAHNKTKGITGILLYHQGIYLQLLEGESGDLDELYSRIDQDPRHCQLIKLVDQEAPENQRCCTDWSMAFRDLSADPSAASESLGFELANLMLSWHQKGADDVSMTEVMALIQKMVHGIQAA